MKNLKLLNFKNHEEKSFDFRKKIILIIGKNAVGKSNLLNAIETISFGVSLKRELEDAKIRDNSEFFEINAVYSLREKIFNLIYRRDINKQKKIFINSIEHKSFTEAKNEIIKSICFKSKESLEVVRASALERRAWLDITLSLLSSSYAENLKRYKKIISHRNKILKDYNFNNINNLNLLAESLEIWDLELSKHAINLIKIRKNFFENNSCKFSEIYNKLSASSESAELLYLPDINKTEQENFYEALKNKRLIDLRKNQSDSGPHRDDFKIFINKKDSRVYGSQGQQRTCVLALMLLQAYCWEEKLGISPIILLDDVTAELDSERQKALLNNLPVNSQVFISTTDFSSLSLDNLNNYQDYQIISL